MNTATAVLDQEKAGSTREQIEALALIWTLLACLRLFPGVGA